MVKKSVRQFSKDAPQRRWRAERHRQKTPRFTTKIIVFVVLCIVFYSIFVHPFAMGSIINNLPLSNNTWCENDCIPSTNGVNGLVIDPCNELDHQRPPNENETEYASQMLTSIKCFAQHHSCHAWFVAHPKQIKEMEASVKQQEKLALQASLHFEKCKKETADRRQQLAAAKRNAESVAVITPALEQEFLQMPSTIEDLNAAIQDITSQANSILFLNHNILEEYERRQRKIEELSTKLESDEKELTSRLEDLNSLKGRWLPTLRNLVAQINETFSRNFQEMAVAGEVSLDEHGNEFDSYGILIKVNFRQTGQLQVLSAHHQSGGERSVSTILYLVSLQDLTHCPFRVVDEINQGMDPINERKMFQQLVRAASQPNTPKTIDFWS